MRNTKDNRLALLSKTSFHSQIKHGLEFDRIRADLEVGKSRTQWSHRHLYVELRHLREKAESNLQKAVRELVARRGRQKKVYFERLARDINEKDIGQSRTSVSTGKEASCSCSRHTHINLELLLLTLYEEIGAVLRHHNGQEFEQEKAIFLCHLLEHHSKRLQERQRALHPSHNLKSLSKKPAQKDGGSPCHSASRSSRETSDTGVYAADPTANATALDTCQCSTLKNCNTPNAVWNDHPPWSSPRTGESTPSKGFNMECGTDYGFLVRQNSEILRALDELEKTCSTLREENALLRKSSAPETEEKVRRLRRKNTELALFAKRLEERARKLQEANLRVISSSSPLRPVSVEQYKRAFARQRARDLAQHADALLCKDKEISALQQECRDLEARLGNNKGLPTQPGRGEFEKLLQESQMEVLRLQRQLSVTSSTQQQHNQRPEPSGSEKSTETEREKKVKVEGVSLDEAPCRCEKTPNEESKQQVKPPLGLSPTLSIQDQDTEKQQLQFLENELGKKRKECEDLEHEVKKRQKRCLDLESQLEDERSKSEHLKEEADLLRRKALLLDQTRSENEELRERLSEVTAQHNSVLEENQRLRVKLENLEQVLKHMREVAERRQQLELEHDQALAILKFKQDEIQRLQRAQLFAKREHEGVVQMLEDLTQLVLRRELTTLDCMQSKVRELEEKCRSQSEQFGLLSQELEKFRLQASKADLASSSLLNNPSLSVLTNGVDLTAERDVVAALRIDSLGLPRRGGSPGTKHRELPSISVSKSASSSSKSESRHLSPKSDSHLSPRKSSPTHEVDTASEVDELDIDAAPAPYIAHRGAAKLQVFIARYSYNPYDGPNDNPDVELPLTAGEYIYVYGDMDDDGFYEGELMDGRRGLVPSNFVERVSDDDVMSTHLPEMGDMSHNSLLDTTLHSASHQHPLHTDASERTETTAASAPASARPSNPASALSVPAPITNGVDFDLEEVGLDIVPYPRKLTLIKQLAKSIIIGWDPPLVPAGWGVVLSYNVFVDQELRLNVTFGAQTKAVLERLDINLKAYRVSVQSVTEKGLSEQLRCSMLVGRDVCVAPTQLRVEGITATSANLTWLPSNSNYVHIVTLNEEEHELVKAGCHSLCLSNLLPSMQYTVKVEARPHRTPWELPVERREHRTTSVSFTTLMAGPPDAPLDVQLEHGPSPGIALISWLPVTIDAAGTSNGVRVTGYTIYADKKKVLEVSSPTAGSVLLGPSQIQALHVAQELTVRTMSAHGESCDSLPVNVPSKLATIMSGPTPPAPAKPLPQDCAPAGHNKMPLPLSYMNSAAKDSMPLCTLPSQNTGLSVEAPANFSKTLHSTDFPSSASYVKAWANPSAASLPMCETISPVGNAVTPVVNVTSPIKSPPEPSPAVAPPPGPGPAMAKDAAAVLEQRRDTDSPGIIRPFPSITEFIEDNCAKLGTPERIPSPPKAPVMDLLNPQDTNLLRPPSTSTLESEVEDDEENTRLVSIEDFLRQDNEPVYSTRQQNHNRGLTDPSTDYHGDNSRSDLSDILEEEEEDLSSDHLGVQTIASTAGVNRFYKLDPPDSDEEVSGGILKLPTQVSNNKELCSIPELTEEEDSNREESSRHRMHNRHKTRQLQSSDPHQIHPVPKQHHCNPQTTLHHHNVNRDHKPLIRDPSSRRGPLQVKPKTQHRVHYADTVDTFTYVDEEDSFYEGPSTRRVSFCSPPQPTPLSRERVPLKGLGDQLRREAMMKSQKAVPPRTIPVSKTVHHVRSPVGHTMEIDVEYGADTNEEPTMSSAGDVVVEQMSSEWWVERAPVERCRPSLRRGLRREPPTNLNPGQLKWEDSDKLPSSEASPLRGTKTEPCLQVKNPYAVADSPMVKRGRDIRIFVALFSYDPATMSPNPDAAEEELPFVEGQIVKVYGDKDADGFYQGEAGNRSGYVPCNMVSEIQVEDDETRQQLLQQGFLSTAASMEKIGTRTHAQLPRCPVPPPKPRRSKKVESAALCEESVDSCSSDPSQKSAAASAHTSPTAAAAAAGGPAAAGGGAGPAVAAGAAAAPAVTATGNTVVGARRMVAIFDYDPRESSPNTDIEAELTFSAGDVIKVFGDMDEDGFFFGDLNGHRGLVPSNFLQAVPEEAAAEPVSAQPALPAKKESQAAMISSEPHPDQPTEEECLQKQTEPSPPDLAKNPDLSPGPAPPESSASEPLPAVGQVLDPAAAKTLNSPLDTPTKADCSPTGKKKKGFFSKGKKLFKKLGSSKKE